MSSGRTRLKTEKAEVLEVVDEWYKKRDGTVIRAIRLKGHQHPFVDWMGKIKEVPKIGDVVEVTYRDWKPTYGDIPFHHTIEDFRISPPSSLSLDEIKEMLKRILEAIDKLKLEGR